MNNGPDINPIGVDPHGKHTLIALVLDESGSMACRWKETIDSVNKFMDEQKASPGRLEMVLTKFSSTFNMMGPKAAADFPSLNSANYCPSGSTALLEALGQTIDRVGEILANRGAAIRPELVIVVVMTDGEENASSAQWTAQRVSQMIAHQEQNYAWQFVFLGVGGKAFLQHAGLGIDVGTSMALGQDPIAVASAFASTSSNLRAYRTSGDPNSLKYTEAQRSQADTDSQRLPK